MYVFIAGTVARPCHYLFIIFLKKKFTVLTESQNYNYIGTLSKHAEVCRLVFDDGLTSIIIVFFFTFNFSPVSVQLFLPIFLSGVRELYTVHIILNILAVIIAAYCGR